MLSGDAELIAFLRQEFGAPIYGDGGKVRAVSNSMGHSHNKCLTTLTSTCNGKLNLEILAGYIDTTGKEPDFDQPR